MVQFRRDVLGCRGTALRGLSGRCVLRAGKGDFAPSVRGRRGENGRVRVVLVREGDFGWEADGEVVRKEMQQVG